MIAVLTWISVIILGPGALTVFIWFLIDMRRMIDSSAPDKPPGDAGAD